MEFACQDMYWNYEMAPVFVAVALAACRCTSDFQLSMERSSRCEGPVIAWSNRL
jgi:hypothetical protein